MAAPLTQLRANPLTRAFSLLFGAHLVGLLVPLLTVPWLARQLGQEGWAPVLVAQSLGGWAIMLLEFGFDLAGTRAIAQAGDASGMAAAAARIQRARLLLTPVVAVIMVGTAVLLPSLGPAFIVATLVFVIARGFSPFWYFQGIQRIRFAAVVETLGKVIPALALFVLVTSPEHGWRVIALQAAGACVATALLTARMHGSVTLPRVTNRAALATLREAAPTFGARAASGLYIHANTLLLSIFAGPAAVAAFGGAERIVRAAINLLLPVTQAYFPHVSRLAASDPQRAWASIRKALVTLGAAGALGAAATALLAPLLVQILLGTGFEASVPVLRLLGLNLPLIAAGTVLGIFWALPWRRERLFLAAVALGGAVNLALAFALIPGWGPLGMAFSVIVAELAVTGLLALAFARSVAKSRGGAATAMVRR